MTLAERIARYKANPAGRGYNGIEEDREAIARWFVWTLVPKMNHARHELANALELLDLMKETISLPAAKPKGNRATSPPAA